jgi:hypothetical protein
MTLCVGNRVRFWPTHVPQPARFRRSDKQHSYLRGLRQPDPPSARGCSEASRRSFRLTSNSIDHAGVAAERLSRFGKILEQGVYLKKLFLIMALGAMLPVARASHLIRPTPKRCCECVSQTMQRLITHIVSGSSWVLRISWSKSASKEEISSIGRGACVCQKHSHQETLRVQSFVNWAEQNPKEWGNDYMFSVVLAL